MTATICPTILAEELHGFFVQLKRVEAFATRVHIDLMDGIFASPKSISLAEVSWPANMTIDLHIMYKQPFAHTDAFLALAPRMVIVHAEAEGDFVAFAGSLHRHGIEVGVALLPPTPVSTIAPAIQHIDHVLIFSGHLGHFGGAANLGLLQKAAQLRTLKPSIEIGWDGGVSTANAHQLAAGGVDVLNAGGFIQHARDPRAAFQQLEQAMISAV